MKYITLHPNLIRGARQNNMHLALAQTHVGFRAEVLTVLPRDADLVHMILIGDKL